MEVTLLVGDERDLHVYKRLLRLLDELDIQKKQLDFDLKFDVLTRTVAILEKYRQVLVFYC